MLVVILNGVSHSKTVLVWKFLRNTDVAIVCIWVVYWRLYFIQKLLFLKLIGISHLFNHPLFNTDTPRMLLIIILVVNWKYGIAISLSVLYFRSLMSILFVEVVCVIDVYCLELSLLLVFRTDVQLVYRVTHGGADRICIWCLDVDIYVSLMVIVFHIIILFLNFGISTNISLILNVIKIKL